MITTNSRGLRMAIFIGTTCILTISGGPGIAAAPKVRTNPLDHLRYVWIEPGTFMMGCADGVPACSDEEKPAHTVQITKGYWIGETEVPVASYQRFATATGQRMPDESDFLGRKLNPAWQQGDLPIVNLTWGDAGRFCEWTGGRLPTAAEWEYAARGGSAAPLYGERDRISWHANNSGTPIDIEKALKALPAGDGRKLLDILKDNGNTMHVVGQKAPNAFGLHDMIGNVLEWVSDWDAPTAATVSQQRDPQGPAAGTRKGTRGGSWITAPERLRVTLRNHSALDYKSNYLGVRCAQN